MKTGILTVGTEILFGQITNTNTVYLSQQLNLLGFDVLYHFTVGDNSQRLKETLDKAYEDCDLLVLTGGLGPTEDDLTKETVCEYFGDRLVQDQASLDHINDMARRRGWKLTPNNFKQAMMPETAVIFPNTRGSAPGFAIEKDGKVAIVMPGPPAEMKAMFENSAMPYLKKFETTVIRYKMLRFFGIGESALETKILPLIHSGSPVTLATYAKSGECQVRLAVKSEDDEKAEALLQDMTEKVKAVVGEFMYSEDGDDINYAVGKTLIEKNISFSCCESCTGGLFAAKMVEVPGISKVFERGIVTYSYRAKREELGVKEETLEKYTAESPEVALEMVRGLKEKTGSRLCISMTGVAGPEAMGPEKPAGLMYIGIIFDDMEKVVEVRTNKPERNYNRNYGYLSMADEIRKLI